MAAAKTWTLKVAAKTGLVIKLRMEPETGSLMTYQEKTVDAQLVDHNSLNGRSAIRTGFVREH